MRWGSHINSGTCACALFNIFHVIFRFLQCLKKISLANERIVQGHINKKSAIKILVQNQRMASTSQNATQLYDSRDLARLVSELRDDVLTVVLV